VDSAPPSTRTVTAARPGIAARPLAVAIAALAIATVVVASVISPGVSHAQAWSAPIVPAAQPFTLNSYDALDAVALLYRVGFVQLRFGDGSLRTIRVRTARTVWVDYDPDAYEAHRNRYDVVVNETPIDWDHTYIEYERRMVNLRLLYTYRNQQPIIPPRYRLP
jgi:hypothetical protein